MIPKCSHPFKKIDGLWPVSLSGEHFPIAFTCLVCRSSGAMRWEDASKLEQDRARTLGTPGTFRAAGVI